MAKTLKIFFVIICTGMALQVLHAQQTNRPNILIIIGDDGTHNDLPLYGGKNVKTPNIEKLASEGLTFNKAYVSMAMCTPSRTELYTGMYPTKSGVCWNHGNARQGTESIVQHLAKYGYRTGIAGKTHIQPKEVFPFEMVPGVKRNCVKKNSRF